MAYIAKRQVVLAIYRLGLHIAARLSLTNSRVAAVAEIVEIVAAE